MGLIQNLYCVYGKVGTCSPVQQCGSLLCFQDHNRTLWHTETTGWTQRQYFSLIRSIYGCFFSLFVRFVRDRISKFAVNRLQCGEKNKPYHVARKCPDKLFQTQQKSYYCPEMFGINSRVQQCVGGEDDTDLSHDVGIYPHLGKSQKRSRYFASGRRVHRVLFWSKLEGPPEPLHHRTPTHLPTVRFWNKAFGSTSYLVINVKRPLNIIDVGCDAHTHTHKTLEHPAKWRLKRRTLL